MGIFDFVTGGVRELMIARPDHLKNLVVYKHPDQNVPFWSQLTVDSDECALFFKDGQFQGVLSPGRHTLSSDNIPFLNNLVNRLTGGNVFIAEIFFVKTQPVRGIPFGGPLESMEDPILFEFVTPRIFGEFSLVVTDPVRFVVSYHGQCSGPPGNDNDIIFNWVKNKFFMAVKSVIGQTCAKQQKSLLNLGGMSAELTAMIVASAPSCEDIGCKILEVGHFQLNFSAEDNALLRNANKARGEAKRNAGIAVDVAQAKQVELDQWFQQDSRYVRDLAGSYQGYAAGQAIMGAGEGMAKGGDGAGIAQLGAQMAVGLGMGQAMQHAAVPTAPTRQAPMAGTSLTSCPHCNKAVPPGKFCQECGGALASAKKFCTGCGTDVSAVKFCSNCGTPA